MVGRVTDDRPLLAIIPARGGSKRFPRKNLALLGGRPLLSYAIDAARAAGIFDTICVSSEDEEVLTVARTLGADEAVRRPAALASDSAQVKDVCRELLLSYQSAGRPWAAFAVLLPTSPLRTGEDIRRAHELFVRERADSVMSLVPCAHPPQRAVRIEDGRVRPFLGVEYMKQTQRLEPLYQHDGAIILARTSVFLREGELYGSGVVPYYMPPEHSVDIDSPLDLAWAEFRLTSHASGVRQ